MAVVLDMMPQMVFLDFILTVTRIWSKRLRHLKRRSNGSKVQR